MKSGGLKPIKPKRNVLMLDKLRSGLEEYVRLYNPITCNWRDLKLRANRGPDRIRIVGLDDDDTTDYYDIEDYSSSVGLTSRRIENDDILDPIFDRKSNVGIKRYGSLDELSTVRRTTDPLPPLTDRVIHKKRFPTNRNSVDKSDERKKRIQATLQQMGMLKQNLQKHQRKHTNYEQARELSAKRQSLSVIKESPMKMVADSEVVTPVKELVEEVAPLKTASSDRSKKGVNIYQKRGSIDSNAEYSSFGIGGRRGLRHRKRKPMLGSKFKRLCKFFLVLYRLWKSHCIKVEKMLETFDALDALVGPKTVEKKSQPKDELVFDLSLYKNTDEARIPREAKRILQAKPGTRSEDELHYLKIALRNYQSIVEYPTHMQKMLSERAWYEGFEPKRVIIREGHAPWNFYFILSGAVIISKYDHEKNIDKTVTFLGKGDSFGELAIMNNSRRENTVVTKEKTEFLVVNADDFREIFLSGGLGNPKDPFLNSLWYLKGWPLSQLGKNPRKAIFNFYKRNLVLSKDTGTSDWIYIVKSGSISIYKELQYEQPDALKPRIKKKRKPLEVEHADKLESIFEQQIADLYNNKLLNRLLLQPNELNIDVQETSGLYGRYGLLHHQHHLQDISGNMSEQTSALNLFNNKKQSDSNNPTQPPSGSMSRERSLATIDTKNKKHVSFSVTGPILTKSNMQPLPPAADPDEEKKKANLDHTRISVMNNSMAVYRDPNEVISEAEDRTTEDQEDHMDIKKLPKTQFITVQTLTKGSVFGLADVVYGAKNMPRFSLVSNGAEVIMIDKKLYEDHASQRLLTDLREQIYPYPSEEALQEMLKTTINWDHNCKATFSNTLHDILRRNANIHDARSGLDIKKPVVT